MYDHTKDMPAPGNTAPLDNTLPNHSIPEQDGEASTNYSHDLNPQCDVAELQQQFKLQE